MNTIYNSETNVIPSAVADFFLRSRRANVGHGAEGPWQHVKFTTVIGTISVSRAVSYRNAVLRRGVA